MKDLNLFYKPNQLISVGKEGITRLQFESMNVLLKKAQDKIHYNVGVSDGSIKKSEGEKVLSEAELLTYTYYINIKDYMDNVSLSLRPKDMRGVEKLLKDLSLTQLESHHKNKIEFQNIFQRVTFNINYHRIEFQISTEITKLFISKCGLINENGEYKSGNYTAIPHYNKKFKELIGNVKLSDSTYYFYEWIMQYAKQSQGSIYTDDKPFYTNVNIEDLKDILGCKSYNLQDFKKKILKKAKEDLSKLNFHVDYKVIGRGKNAEDISIIIYKNSVIPEFLYSEIELLTKNNLKKDENVECKTIQPQETQSQKPSSNGKYTLQKGNISLLGFHKIVPNSPISHVYIAEINNAKTYEYYEDKFISYVDEKDYRHKVNMSEFNEGYRFREYNESNVEVVQDYYSDPELEELL